MFSLPILLRPSHDYIFPLTFESEVQADLVGSSIELLRVERRTKTKRHAGAQEDVISKSSNTTLIDFDLFGGRKKGSS